MSFVMPSATASMHRLQTDCRVAQLCSMLAWCSKLALPDELPSAVATGMLTATVCSCIVPSLGCGHGTLCCGACQSLVDAKAVERVARL